METIEKHDTPHAKLVTDTGCQGILETSLHFQYSSLTSANKQALEKSLRGPINLQI
jgi:hypothetical protein